MDDVAFLAAVREQLEPAVRHVARVIDVRPTRGRPWPRAEVTFHMVGVPASWTGPTAGSAYFPLGEEWRYASGHEEVADYARALARSVESAAHRLVDPAPASPPATPQQVDERWQWLLERLALNGPVRAEGAGRLVVEVEEEGSFTVLVTPEEWAEIAEPLDPISDDPQDFNQLHEEETFLVFHEGVLEWSVREELPPVRWGTDVKRRYRAARARGVTNIGWTGVRPGRKATPPAPSLFDLDPE